MKILVVGLGNIGEKYENTRHNIGFDVVEYLANKFNVSFSLERFAYKSEFNYAGKKFIIIKPTTYVNLSGKAAKYWLNKLKIPIENFIVITDDIAFPFGTIKLKPKGSAGGHNGLESLEKYLGTNKYARIRFGIGNDFTYGNQVEYVLGKWKPTEKELLPKLIEKAANIVIDFGKIGLQNTMNKYNKK